MTCLSALLVICHLLQVRKALQQGQELWQASVQAAVLQRPRGLSPMLRNLRQEAELWAPPLSCEITHCSSTPLPCPPTYLLDALRGLEAVPMSHFLLLAALELFSTQAKSSRARRAPGISNHADQTFSNINAETPCLFSWNNH